jgi:hypothetical protein
MTKLNKKGSLPDYIGGQPPSPRDLAHKGPMHDERQCQNQPTLPHASVTNCGAQVASQHYPILRTGMRIVSKLIKITSRQLSKTKKWRLKTASQNWGKIVRIIHPI